jgi:hypothetical protein
MVKARHTDSGTLIHKEQWYVLGTEIIGVIRVVAVVPTCLPENTTANATRPAVGSAKSSSPLSLPTAELIPPRTPLRTRTGPPRRQSAAAYSNTTTGPHE